MSKSKEELLKTIKSKEYQIYGIFDFKKKELIYIHLEQDQVELEFEMSNYDETRYDIVEFRVKLM